MRHQNCVYLARAQKNRATQLDPTTQDAYPLQDQELASTTQVSCTGIEDFTACLTKSWLCAVHPDTLQHAIQVLRNMSVVV